MLLFVLDNARANLTHLPQRETSWHWYNICIEEQKSDTTDN